MSDFWVRKMRTFFVRVDFDNDNLVTKEDFKKMAERFIAEGQLSEECGNKLRASLFAFWEKFWHHLGGKDREAIKEDEFLTAMKEIIKCPNAREVLKKPLPCFFEAVDTNHDQQISTEEYSMFFKCMGIDTGLADQSFKAIDTNHDGNLSLDEFVFAGMEFFTEQNSTEASHNFWGPLL